jgi:hypothetical protein
MIITLTFKSPDGVWDSLEDAGLDPNELPDDVDRVLTRFVEYREYVRIELDTEAGTARVLEN